MLRRVVALAALMLVFQACNCGTPANADGGAAGWAVAAEEEAAAMAGLAAAEAPAVQRAAEQAVVPEEQGTCRTRAPVGRLGSPVRRRCRVVGGSA